MAPTQKHITDTRFPSNSDHPAVNFERQNHALSRELERKERQNRQLREKVKRLENSSRQLINSIQSHVLVLDKNGEITAYNPVMQKLTGRKALVGKSLHEILPELSREWMGKALFNAIQTGKTFQMKDVAYKTVDDEDITMDIHIQPHTDQAGKTQGAFLFIDDVTEQRKLEKRLLRSEKAAPIGRLSANLAHELGNPLDGILRYLHMLLDRMPINDPRRMYAEHARDGVTRVSDMARGLLDFARKSSSVLILSPIDIAEAIGEILSSFDAQVATQNIKIETEFDEDIPIILNTDVEQIFANIIKNAIQAMPNGGTLSIKARMLLPELFEASFSDTGMGIPDEMQEAIFEPFFTTKGFGQGVGLGLAISQEIIENYNGSIELESKLDKGTTFVIRLPVNEEGLTVYQVESYAVSHD